MYFLVIHFIPLSNFYQTFFSKSNYFEMSWLQLKIVFSNICIKMYFEVNYSRHYYVEYPKLFIEWRSSVHLWQTTYAVHQITEYWKSNSLRGEWLTCWNRTIAIYCALQINYHWIASNFFHALPLFQLIEDNDAEPMKWLRLMNVAPSTQIRPNIHAPINGKTKRNDERNSSSLILSLSWIIPN